MAGTEGLLEGPDLRFASAGADGRGASRGASMLCELVESELLKECFEGGCYRGYSGGYQGLGLAQNSSCTTSQARKQASLGEPNGLTVIHMDSVVFFGLWHRPWAVHVIVREGMSDIEYDTADCMGSCSEQNPQDLSLSIIRIVDWKKL